MCSSSNTFHFVDFCLSNCFELSEEQEKLALGAEAMDEGSEQDVAMGTDDEHSSDDGFGFAKKAQVKDQKVPESLDQQKSEQKEPKAEKPRKRAAPADPTNKVEKAKKPEKLLAQGKTAAAAMDAISPLMIWQGKGKEAEGKIEKARAVIQSLENDGDPQCLEAAKHLKDKVLNLEKNLELLTIDYIGRAAEEFQKMDSDFLDRFCELPADCANAMLSDFGRALLEDSFVWRIMRNTVCGLMR